MRTESVRTPIAAESVERPSKRIRSPTAAQERMASGFPDGPYFRVRGPSATPPAETLKCNARPRVQPHGVNGLLAAERD